MRPEPRQCATYSGWPLSCVLRHSFLSASVDLQWQVENLEVDDVRYFNYLCAEGIRRGRWVSYPTCLLARRTSSLKKTVPVGGQSDCVCHHCPLLQCFSRWAIHFESHRCRWCIASTARSGDNASKVLLVWSHFLHFMYSVLGPLLRLFELNRSSDDPSMCKTYLISGTEESLAKVSWHMRTRDTTDCGSSASRISTLSRASELEMNSLENFIVPVEEPLGQHWLLLSLASLPMFRMGEGRN